MRRTRQQRRALERSRRTGQGAGRGAGSRPFGPEEKQRALEMVARGIKRVEVATAIGASTETLRLWWNRAKREGTLPIVDKDKQQKECAPPEQLDVRGPEASGPAEASRTKAPLDPGYGLSAAEVESILDWKKRHPTMGPAQIRAQLKRFKGWRISVKAIGRALKKNGYELEHRDSRPQGWEPHRFEAPHRNALWQVDFMEARLEVAKLFLLVILDDFSRFLVAVKVFKEPSSQAVVGTLKEAIRLHGKPEAIYTDRAGAFLAWRDVSDFQSFCEAELIDHHVSRSYHPQGRGKVEAVIRTLQQELWQVQHFQDEMEMERAIAAFVKRYNHDRAHMGIDGLTPADRYFGRWPEVLERINAISRQRNGVGRGDREALPDDLSFCAQAPVEALRLLIHQGKMEIRLFGHRVVLGEIQS